jgi:hypothetical protein
LKDAFRSLEELDTFVEFVKAGILYFENGAITVKSNLPADNLDKMKIILLQAADMRNFYLGGRR